MGKRQFPVLHVKEARPENYVLQVCVYGNRAGLESLLMLVKEALNDAAECRDEAGQTRYGCKHGPDEWITITVRNDDVLNALPDCQDCAGLGADFAQGAGCLACGGTGRAIPESCKRDLPFFT